MPRMQSVATLIFSLVVLALSLALAVVSPGRHELYGENVRPNAAGPGRVTSGR